MPSNALICFRARVPTSRSRDPRGAEVLELLRRFGVEDRSLELKSVAHEVQPGRRKIAVKVVDIFGNDTMTILSVTAGGER